MPVIVTGRDRNPLITYRRVRSTIDALGAKQPRDVLRWIANAIDGRDWDIHVIRERASFALAHNKGGDESLVDVLDEITSICNYHLNVQ